MRRSFINKYIWMRLFSAIWIQNGSNHGIATQWLWLQINSILVILNYRQDKFIFTFSCSTMLPNAIIWSSENLCHLLYLIYNYGFLALVFGMSHHHWCDNSARLHRLHSNTQKKKQTLSSGCKESLLRFLLTHVAKSHFPTNTEYSTSDIFCGSLQMG